MQSAWHNSDHGKNSGLLRSTPRITGAGKLVSSVLTEDSLAERHKGAGGPPAQPAGREGCGQPYSGWCAGRLCLGPRELLSSGGSGLFPLGTRITPGLESASLDPQLEGFRRNYFSLVPQFPNMYKGHDSNTCPTVLL